MQTRAGWIAVGVLLSALWVLPAGAWGAEDDGNALGPDVQGGAPGGIPETPAVTGVVGLTTIPTGEQTLYVEPRFGRVQLTTAGKQTTEIGAPPWQWPRPTLTMPAPVEFLGGHAAAWRAVTAAAAAAKTPPAEGTPAAGLPPPTIDLIGSAGKQAVPAAQLAWHRQLFADPVKLRTWIDKLNGRDQTNHAQAIQFYFRTIELGQIDPQGGPDGTAAYQDCFVAVEARPLLVGGGFEAEPVLIENQAVKEVHAKYWLDCGFAEPVEEKFIFTNLRRIKLQLPQRRRNFLGFLHWLNGDWLEIGPDEEVAAVKPIRSLDFATAADFLAALQAVRTQFKDKKPKLMLVKMGPDLRERVAAMYQGVGAEKE